MKRYCVQWQEYFQRQRRDEGIRDEPELPGGKSLGIFPDADAVFHLFLSESTGNRFLVQQTETLMAQTQRIRCLSNIRSRENLLRSTEEHLAILAAVLAGDGDQADLLVRAHLERSRAGYGQLLVP